MKENNNRMRIIEKEIKYEEVNEEIVNEEQEAADVKAEAPEEKEKKELTGYINRRRFILVLLSLFCVYLLINVISIRVRLYEQKQQLNLITEQIEIAQLENDELRHMMSGTEAEYIERIAREKLGYAAVDERVYEDINGVD